MEGIKEWDCVKRRPECRSGLWINDDAIYKVKKISLNELWLVGWPNWGSWRADRFYRTTPIDVPEENVSDFKQTITIPTMNYYHTAVLIKSAATGTASEIKMVELVPYSVRQAHSGNDMRDTLVRELKKWVETIDCEFKISQIF